MTEEQWNACADSKAMLGLVRAKASDRKLWLFASACLRRVYARMGWSPVSDGPMREAMLGDNTGRAATWQATQVTDLIRHLGDDRLREEPQAQTDLLREITGNPFRPVAFDPQWRTPDVLLLASSIYDGGNFGPMPILADALQDAGCTLEQLLTHLRTGDPPVRGCWALDLVLGKE